MFLESYNQQHPAEEQLTLPALMQSLQSAIEELNNEEEVQVADATVSVNEATGEQLPWIVLLLDHVAPALELYPDIDGFLQTW